MRAQMNSKRIFLIAAAAIAAGAFSVKPAFASLLAYEPFNETNTYAGDGYPDDGSPVDGVTITGTGFTGAYYNDNGAGFESPSLTNSLVSSQGNKLGTIGGNNNSFYATALLNTNSGGPFDSYLESSGGANTSGNNIGASGTTLYFSFLFAEGSATATNGGINFLRDTDNGNQSGILNVNVTATSVEPSADLYVGEIQFGTSDNDTFYAGTDPTSSSGLALVGTGNYSFDRLEFLGTKYFKFDELRMGTTFGDVVPNAPVPEPASVAVLGLSCVGLLARRRRGQ
jgi:hypothetical protein